MRISSVRILASSVKRRRCNHGQLVRSCLTCGWFGVDTCDNIHLGNNCVCETERYDRRNDCSGQCHIDSDAPGIGSHGPRVFNGLEVPEWGAGSGRSSVCRANLRGRRCGPRCRLWCWRCAEVGSWPLFAFLTCRGEHMLKKANSGRSTSNRQKKVRDWMFVIGASLAAIALIFAIMRFVEFLLDPVVVFVF